VTVRFRLDRVRVATDGGEVSYEFPSPLTVLAGKVGVGKSTLVTAIKYALGGSTRLYPVLLEHATSVAVDVQVGQERYSISRSFDPELGKVARVVDLRTQERLHDLPVRPGEGTLSGLLLTALGLPTDMHAAGRGSTSSTGGARITFPDIFRYMYVPQGDMSTQIASSDDQHLSPKRKAVFELLFGLSDPELLALRSDHALAKIAMQEAERERDTVLRFLRDSRTPDRAELERELEEQRDEAATARRELDELRNAVDPVEDRHTRLLRDLLAQSERDAAAAHEEVQRARQELSDLESERRRVDQELQRLARLRSAGERLAHFEFVTCPRCLQSVRSRDVPAGSCRLCLQPEDTSEISNEHEVYEERQLREQAEELALQMHLLSEHTEASQASTHERRAMARKLALEVDERLRTRVAPRMQAYADASMLLGEVSARLHSSEAALRQWDRVADLERAVSSASSERDRLAAEIERLESALDARRGEMFAALNEAFTETVRALQIPGIRHVEISSTSYLPVLDGRPFDKFSPPGGLRTLVQVAYWLTLVSVARRQGDTNYPSFLLLDSPRTALNEITGAHSELAARMYARVVTQVDAADGALQVVIADNELPATYRSGFAEIELTYERPSIYTVAHPGPPDDARPQTAPEEPAE
jgi:hypothetical protein